MTPTPIISVKKLCVTYFPGKSNEVRALKNIELDIYPGEFIIFFGPSGCGKSTLLYSLSGLERNITGSILVKGEDLPTMKPKQREEFHQRTIGMVFQAYYLIASLSVLENVTLPQVALSEPIHVREPKALALLDKFGVKAQAKKLPMELSGGQQQRVAICRSVMNDPDIIFADEPVGNLDSKSTDEVMKLLRELNERDHKTVILVTHDPSHLHHANRVFFIRDGEVVRVQENSAEERKQSPVVEAAKAVQPNLQEWAKTLTADDLKRISVASEDQKHSEIEKLLESLSPAQRIIAEQYLRDLLAGTQPPTTDEEMERLARGIVRLLSNDTHSDTVRVRTHTWPRGSDVLCFQSSSPTAFPYLTLAVRVRLRPFMLRMKWMLMEGMQRFVLQRLPSLRSMAATVQSLVRQLLRSSLNMAMLLLRLLRKAVSRASVYIRARLEIVARIVFAQLRRCSLAATAAARVIWQALRTICVAGAHRVSQVSLIVLAAIRRATAISMRITAIAAHRITLMAAATLRRIRQAGIRAFCLLYAIVTQWIAGMLAGIRRAAVITVDALRVLHGLIRNFGIRMHRCAVRFASRIQLRSVLLVARLRSLCVEVLRRVMELLTGICSRTCALLRFIHFELRLLIQALQRLCTAGLAAIRCAIANFLFHLRQTSCPFRPAVSSSSIPDLIRDSSATLPPAAPVHSLLSRICTTSRRLLIRLGACIIRQMRREIDAIRSLHFS